MIPIVQLFPRLPTYFANHVYHHEIGLKLSVEKLISGTDKYLWNTSMSNEFGCLAQWVVKDRLSAKYVKGTNTIFFVQKSQVLTDAKVPYANLIYDIKPSSLKHTQCARRWFLINLITMENPSLPPSPFSKSRFSLIA